MSDTPRTDAVCEHPSNTALDNSMKERRGDASVILEVVPADHARVLERELTNSRRACAELVKENSKLRDALTRITKIRWGWDGDCGAKGIAEDAL